MIKHYHLIGIGGIGMSGIAYLLLRNGSKVSGSDLKENKITEELKRQGAQIFLGHRAENIKGADVVIYSSAIKEKNPEMIEARINNMLLLKRAQALAGLMQDKIVITVTGSHGKTTTASLISYLLIQAELMPTVAIGGILRNIDTNAYFGKGKFFVAEADESDGSFLYYQPNYSVITNIDREHLDYYGDFEKEINAFGEFINKTRDGGCLFCCDDDANIKALLAGYKGKYVLFGLHETADIYPKEIKMTGLASEFDCFYRGRFISRFFLALGGNHNISNSLSVIALGLELGIDLKTIKKSLAEYKGAKRRLEIKFNDKGVMIIDDYAHHPTEIAATLSALKNLNRKRIIAVFQPHRYTRTKILLDEFGKCFNEADYIIITDIYPASEIPIEGINGRSVCDKIKQYAPGKEICFLPKDKITEKLLKILAPGDLAITLGAGDIIRINDELVQRLESQN